MYEVIEFVKKYENRVWPGRQGRGTLPREERKPIVIRATGGGAVKHQSSLRTAGIRLDLEDEMAAMIGGLDYLLRRIPGELFSVDMTALGKVWTPLATPEDCAEVARRYVPCEKPPQEFLYVSIGSGCSILEVHTSDDGVTRYRRVGGSSVGGSTFWGLVRLLTSCSTFDEVIRLTESGSSANVDMLVGDIYGGDCDAIGLKGDVIAASFGKVSMQREDEFFQGPMFALRYVAALIRHYEEGFWLIVLAILNSIPGVKHVASLIGIIRWAESRAASVSMCGRFRAHDVALSLLRMVSNNIGHIACLCAQQYKLPHIIFGGSFIRDHPYTIATISSGVRYYSRGAVEALFLKHDGFVGAVGAHVAGEAGAGGTVLRMPDSTPAAAPLPMGADPAFFSGAAMRDPRARAPDGEVAAELEQRLAAEAAHRRQLEAEIEALQQQLDAAAADALPGRPAPSPPPAAPAAPASAPAGMTPSA